MKIILVVGARPNFMKVAPILHALVKQSVVQSVQVKLVHTGQHYDRAMSTSFFEDLDIPQPDVHLGVGSGSHAEQTAKVMVGFEGVCLTEQPDWVVVVGDVNSTLACAITAKKLGIKTAHVEAGLRSRDMSMPEEINRLCTDAIADLLFTTDEIANQNLAQEGVHPDRICLVGNTMIDTLLKHLTRAENLPLPAGVSNGGYGVVTLHRASNVDTAQTLLPLIEMMQTVSRDLPLVFPIHPRTRKNLETFGVSMPAGSNIKLTEPLGYLEFIGLVSHANFVLTDSGGIQEETTVLGVPCLTMRNNTERPITCSVGTNRLVGTDPETIKGAVASVIHGERPVKRIPPLWDGHAAERIVGRVLSAA